MYGDCFGIMESVSCVCVLWFSSHPVWFPGSAAISYPFCTQHAHFEGVRWQFYGPTRRIPLILIKRDANSRFRERVVRSLRDLFFRFFWIMRVFGLDDHCIAHPGKSSYYSVFSRSVGFSALDSIELVGRTAAVIQSSNLTPVNQYY